METVPKMDRIAARAAQWGIETEHYDALGRRWAVEPMVLEPIIEAIAAAGELVPREISSISPAPAYQGNENLPRRAWALSVQLYSVRSRRNWGHGDFTDLANLIDHAASLGAAGIGLNPLHALFDDRPDEVSPYFPNSRFFLNPLYIDVEAIPEFPRSAAAELQPRIDALRAQDFVDYPGVAQIKRHALHLAYENFAQHASHERRGELDIFRQERGATLARFAAFELLRRRFGRAWWEWPPEWREPHEEAMTRLWSSDGDELRRYEFIQWVAHQQLAACRDGANRLGLPIGLYLDVAVGVRCDGFDAWSDRNFILPSVEIGAPPDLLNTHGQAWGLAGFNPIDLINRDCEPFRNVLQASMQYAGAIRLDHVLGLKRLYFIPRGMQAMQGAYVRFPFEGMLAAAAQVSLANRCIVIGEDLGNVPPGFREMLAAWGVWSYQVMMFQRAADGGFIAPEHYRDNALVTFATHDLATFAGWIEGRDLAVKQGLGFDPGESARDRATAKEALGLAMAGRGLSNVDFSSVAKFLADTPCRLLIVAAEDALGVAEQANLPGTVAEYPNWRRRLPVHLEDLIDEKRFVEIASIMKAGGRQSATTTASPRTA